MPDVGRTDSVLSAQFCVRLVTREDRLDLLIGQLGPPVFHSHSDPENIPSVGVSWLAARPAIAAGRWDEIRAAALRSKLPNR